MPKFEYTAVDEAGAQVSGALIAGSRSAALEQMGNDGLYPVRIQQARQADGRPAALRQAQGGEQRRTAAESGVPGRVPKKRVDAFTRELANLLEAGVPLGRALQILNEQASSAAAGRCWREIREDVVGGTSLADALSRWPRAFPPVYVAMVRAGERGGFLGKVLQQIADFRERERDLLGKATSALVYPAVLSVLAVAVMTFLLTFFIPRFAAVFAEFGGKLPWLTRAIVGTSTFLVRHGLMALLGLAALVVAGRRLLSSEGGKRFLERATLGLPAIGGVVAQFALVRFCSMLGTLLAGGVPLIVALGAAGKAIGNQTLTDAVEQAVSEVQEGSPLARSLGECPQMFPPSVVEMVSVGEQTGRLDKELIRLADTYEKDLDRRLRMLVALAEPALLFVMAALIGTVVIGMLLPVFTLQELIR
ncbi:MAG: type II secretion system F family protein [Planctomycetes bacterium]|nr:type II secretion system F family protein [Planctomycetota bacterium]